MVTEGEAQGIASGHSIGAPRSLPRLDKQKQKDIIKTQEHKYKKGTGFDAGFRNPCIDP